MLPVSCGEPDNPAWPMDGDGEGVDIKMLSYYSKDYH